MIISKGRFLRVANFYLDEAPCQAPVDLVRCIQRTTRLPQAVCTDFPTIWIDLTADPDRLSSAIKKQTRYEIRRAATQDGIVHESPPPTDIVLDEFIQFYRRFASLKGVGDISDRHLSLLASTKVLDFSLARAGTGDSLVWHAYYKDHFRAALLYSASLYRATDDSAFRSLVGRANRYLHWQDLLRFKADGIPIYDFGGWYPGGDDEQRLRINRFKEEFGGEIVTTFNCQYGITLKGKLALAIRSKILGEADP